MIAEKTSSVTTIEKDPTQRFFALIYDGIDRAKYPPEIQKYLYSRRKILESNISRYLGILKSRIGFNYFRKINEFQIKQSFISNGDYDANKGIVIVKKEHKDFVDPRTSLILTTIPRNSRGKTFILPDRIQPINQDMIIKKLEKFNIFWGSPAGIEKGIDIGALVSMHYRDDESKDRFPHMLPKEKNIFFVVAPYQIKDDFNYNQIHPYIEDNFSLLAYYEIVKSQGRSSFQILTDTPQNYEDGYINITS